MPIKNKTHKTQKKKNQSKRRHPLTLFKKYLPKNSNVVEVGCGKGDFVELLNNDGYFKATGYDVIYEGNNKNIFKRFLNSEDKIENFPFLLLIACKHQQLYRKSLHNVLDHLLFRLLKSCYP